MAEDKDGRASDATDRIPLSTRLSAWWQGYDAADLHAYNLARQTRDVGSGAADMHRDIRSRTLEPAAEQDDDDPVWPDSRIDVVQRLFGRGFVHPGGAERMAEICKPFGLTPQQSVMDLSAGLGGGPAALSEFFGVWVSGFERNPKLAAAADRSIKGLRGADKVTVRPLDPGAFAPKSKSVDCIVCRETLCLIQDKVGMLDAIKAALRQGGQVLITDYVAPGEIEGGGRLAEWISSSPEPMGLWTAARYQQALTDRGFDVRIVEDASPLYVRMIRDAFAAFVEAASQSARGEAGPDPFANKPRRRAALVREAEHWARRAALLESGELRVQRLFALKPV